MSKCYLTRSGQRLLLDLARASIRHGVQAGRPFPIVLEEVTAELVVPRASFVTLEKKGRLRGCIGSLEAWRPLAVDVVENAFAAAFRDPRFPPVRGEEVEELEIHLSLLTVPVAMTFNSEADLLTQLRPGVDGLILSDGPCRATFLPAVWAELPTPQLFLTQLKRKAGLAADYWSPGVRIWCYETEMVE